MSATPPAMPAVLPTDGDVRLRPFAGRDVPMLLDQAPGTAGLHLATIATGRANAESGRPDLHSHAALYRRDAGWIGATTDRLAAG